MCKYSCGISTSERCDSSGTRTFPAADGHGRPEEQQTAATAEEEKVEKVKESFVPGHGNPCVRLGSKLTANREAPEHIRNIRGNIHQFRGKKKMFQQKLVIVIRTFLLFFLFQPTAAALVVAATTIDAGECCSSLNELCPRGRGPCFSYSSSCRLFFRYLLIQLSSGANVTMPSREAPPGQPLVPLLLLLSDGGRWHKHLSEVHYPVSLSFSPPSSMASPRKAFPIIYPKEICDNHVPRRHRARDANGRRTSCPPSGSSWQCCDT